MTSFLAFENFKKPWLKQVITVVVLGLVFFIGLTGLEERFAWSQPLPQEQMAASLSRYTVDPLLQQALLCLQQTPVGQESMRRLIAHNTKLSFKALKAFGSVYHQFDALGWMSPSGQHFIYIHEKHRNETPYALAALIAHEALHDDAWNSKAEEVAGWNEEAAVWQFFLNTAPAGMVFKKSPLEHRLNTLVDLAQKKKLARHVYNNNAYQSLPENSPGF
jgi:hypothetical protein